ncbi:cytoskeleton protein RodZ [Collimonas sp. OK242]|uniref:helix-turn-helix domain-containing protein n=1 Tax=Collimonas sp. OK242 TaxID=1798195 RepID=UPI00089B4AFC|nr:helix-turn-helix domain-containing protein [Collimonas sp. OK242]SDY41388.1 cytoskeleton protein RodZ [Collimonas sp. OK242]
MSEPEQLKAEYAGSADVEHVVPETAGAGQLSLGAQLASKREQLGWSVPDVASHLKLAPRQIDAIEADNYAALPTMVMTRGFIRSYAKLLGLDATALLATISPAVAAQPAVSPIHSQLSTPFSESPFHLMGRSKFAYKWLVVLAVLLLLLAVAIRFDVLPGLQNAIQSLTAKSPAAAAAFAAGGEDKASVPVVAAELQAADAAANAALTAAPTAQANGAAGSEADANAAPANAAADAATNVATNNVTNTAAANPAAGGGGELVLNFRQDSWVEIKRADNTVLISRLAKAGSTEAVDMSQPVNAIIGNIAGVDATLRGAPLDLKAGSKTNVARVSLK